MPSSFSMVAWRNKFCPSADDHDCKEVDFFAFDKVVCLARRYFLHIWSCSWVFSMINWSKIDFPLNLQNCLLFFSSVVGFDGYNEHQALTFAHITSWFEKKGDGFICVLLLLLIVSWVWKCKLTFAHITSWFEKMGDGFFCALLLSGRAVVKSSLLLTSHSLKAGLLK
jgi:hypothetical protein